ncbi:hypothetical protein VUR80DRAFT_1933 [Thermomyces stellatus]
MLTASGPLHRRRRRHGVGACLHRRLVRDDKGDCVGGHQAVEAASRILRTIHHRHLEPHLLLRPPCPRRLGSAPAECQGPRL